MTSGSSLLLSWATGIFQFAVVDLEGLTGMSDGQLKNTGGVTSAVNKYSLTESYYISLAVTNSQLLPFQTFLLKIS